MPWYGRVHAAIQIALPGLVPTQATNLALLVSAILAKRTLCLSELARAYPTPARRRVAEARNQADSLLYTTEKNLTEHGDKIGEDDKNKITEAIAGLRKAMEGDDPGAIESATQTLTAASHKLAEEMYKKASAAAGAGGDAGAAAGDGAGAQAKTDEKVVDAEFEEVDPGDRKAS